MKRYLPLALACASIAACHVVDSATPAQTQDAGPDASDVADSAAAWETAADASLDTAAPAPWVAGQPCDTFIDCTSATAKYCDAAHHVCVACYPAAECPAGAACATVLDCPAGSVCQGGKCAKRWCKTDVCVGGTWFACIADGTSYAKGVHCPNRGQVCSAKLKQCAGPISGACDPPCKAGQFCDADSVECQPVTCALPSPWSGHVQRLTSLTLAPKDVGCDLDQDGKPNNALSGAMVAVLKQFNDATAKLFSNGDWVMLLYAPEFNDAGTPFALHLLLGDLPEADAKCDISSPTTPCNYTVRPSAYVLDSTAATCPPKSTMANATVQAGQLTAGGKAVWPKFPLPWLMVSGGIEVNLHSASLKANVAVSGGEWQTAAGLICGAFKVVALKQAVAAAGGDENVVGAVLKPDLDSDGDGTPESVSVALTFESVRGTVVGFAGLW